MRNPVRASFTASTSARLEARADLRAQPITLTAATDATGRVFDAVLIEEGLTQTVGSSGRTRWYDWSALEPAVPLFDGVPVFANETRPGYYDHFPGGSPARNQVGFVKNPRAGFNPATGKRCIYGEVHFPDSFPRAVTIRASLADSFKAGRKTLGLSWSAEGMEDQGRPLLDGQGRPIGNAEFDWLTRVDRVASIELVTDPGAGGVPVAILASAGGKAMKRFLEMLAKFAPEVLAGFDASKASESETWEHVRATFKAKWPEMLKRATAADDSEVAVEGVVRLNEAVKMRAAGKLAQSERVLAIMAGEDVGAADAGAGKGDAKPEDKPKADPKAVDAKPEGDKPKAEDKPANEGDTRTSAKLAAELEELKTEAAATRQRETIREAVAAGLPEETATKLTASWSGRVLSQEQLDRDVKAERTYLESLKKSGRVRDCGPTVEFTASSVTEIDRKFVRACKYFGLQNIPGMEDTFRSCDPYPDLRYFYRDWTGDGDEAVTGKYVEKNLSPEFRAFRGMETGKRAELMASRKQVILQASRNMRVFLEASITTGDWAYVVENAMTLAAIAFYEATPKPIFETFTERRRGIRSFDELKSIRVGEYPLLSKIVTEADDYTAITSPDDERVTWTPAEYGNIETITRRTILGDKINVVPRIPELMGMAWAETVEQLAADLLIGWNGSAINAATAYNGRVPFHATDGNIGSVAFGKDGVQAAILRMRLQKAAGSDRKGVARPTYCVLPIELSLAGDELFGSPGDAESSALRKNTVSFLRPVVSANLRGDADNYYLVGQRPPVEFGFVEDKDTPTIVLQNAPNVGETFANGSVQYKIRLECGGALKDKKMVDGTIVT